MKDFSLEELRAHCAPLQPMLAEAHYRRFIARHVGDIQGWILLLKCLIAQRNFNEARYTIDRFMRLHGRSDVGQRFAITFYFQVGAPAEAYRVARQLETPVLEDQEPLASIVTLLHWLHGVKSPTRSVEIQRTSLHRKLLQLNEDALPLPSSGVDVVLFLKYDWHHSIQQGIASHLRSAGIGCLFLRSIWEVVAARPKVLVVSDALLADRMILAQYLPSCRIVYTRHGLGDKNFSSHAAGQADATCVSSPAVAQEFSTQFMIDRARLWVTGFPQMDPLFRHLADHPSPAAGRTVLVAPTFTKGLNAADILGDRLVDSVRGDDESIRIMIRPHPHSRKTHAHLLQRWSEQAARLPGVSLHAGEDVNLMELFASADMMVSDVSSAGLAWLATGRPLVCLTDPSQARLSPYYAPEGLEWRMHKAAVHVEDALALTTAVRETLKSPPPPNAAYQALRRHLFGGHADGRASERVATRITRWLDEIHSRPHR